MPRRIAGLALVVASLAVVTSCNNDTTTQTSSGSTAVAPTSVASEPVVKEILDQQADPPGAPGRTLTLIRYTIAPGAKLSPHVHPGIQMAYIDAGTLTYTIESGTATVRRASNPSAPEMVTGPTTITLGPADAVTELDAMVHFGQNDGSEPVVIVATLLTESDKDLAVTVTTAAATTTAG